eukprot:927677-Rhodomonas_salina.5
MADPGCAGGVDGDRVCVVGVRGRMQALRSPPQRTRPRRPHTVDDSAAPTSAPDRSKCARQSTAVAYRFVSLTWLHDLSSGLSCQCNSAFSLSEDWMNFPSSEKSIERIWPECPDRTWKFTL